MRRRRRTGGGQWISVEPHIKLLAPVSNICMYACARQLQWHFRCLIAASICQKAKQRGAGKRNYWLWQTVKKFNTADFSGIMMHSSGCTSARPTSHWSFRSAAAWNRFWNGSGGREKRSVRQKSNVSSPSMMLWARTEQMPPGWVP